MNKNDSTVLCQSFLISPVYTAHALTDFSFNIPVAPPKLPGSTMTTFIPNFLISSLKLSEKASPANLAMVYAEATGNAQRPLTLVTLITRPTVKKKK